MNCNRLSIAVLVLLLTAAAASAAVPTAAQRAKLDPDVLARVEAGDASIPVIVTVEAGPDARLRLGGPGVPIPRARLQAVERALDTGLAEIRDLARSMNLEIVRSFVLQPAFAARADADAVLAMADLDCVIHIEPDRIWHTQTAQGLPMIHADIVHDMGYTGQGTAVAIIDTGVDYNHPTLGGGPIPNDKVVYGKDTADRDDDPMDCEGHGTAVASIAAGYPHQWSSVRKFAGGVAPDAKVLAYKASEDSSCGSFSTSAVISAIEDAVLHRDDYNVVAINLSIGGGLFAGPCDNRSGSYGNAVNEATDAGIAVVVSAGNEGAKTQLASPGCLSNAISVGSVYDTDIGFPGYSYCANSTCSEILCTDANVPAETPTCYSNSDPYLDIMAPSEKLTAAKSGGTTTDFGGTSGAAPYITGSVALIAQAIPGIDPTGIRMLLEMTGKPITDPANGETHPLADLSAAVRSSGVALPNYYRLSIPNGTGSAARSSAVVTQNGFVDGVRVMVKITHPKPTDLVVTLISPDGTRVKLHDHTEGTTPSDAIDATFGSNGIYGVYPDSLTPAESLDGFKNLEASGTWSLEVLDDQANTQGGVDPVLIGWAIEVTTKEAPEPPSGSSLYIPVGVHASGSNNTFWVTDVRLFNPSYSDTASLKVYLIPKGADGTVDFQQTNVSVDPQSILSLPDILANRFGAESLQGNLIFETDDPHLLATSRTYNTGGGSGTYGQYIDMARASAAIGSDDAPSYLVQLARNSAFRTNIGFSEVAGHQATVRVELFDGSTGSPIGTPQQYTIKPFSNVQINRIFEELSAGTSGNAYARITVTSGEGRVVAYGSVVDNATGDAIYIPAQRPGTGAVLVPIAAKKSGSAGTNWVTDLRVFNGGSAAVDLTLEYRPESGTGGSPATATRTVPAGHVLALDDVLSSTFGLSDASGSIRIVPGSGDAPLIVTSRTYNLVSGGTYGQFIGGVRTGIAKGGSAVVFHLDKNSQFRTNVGIAEVSGGTITMRYVLKDSNGNTLGVGNLDLGPWEVKQINDIYSAVGAAAADNTRVDFYCDSGDGTFTAYASVIDHDSGDAIYIPAKAY